MTDLHITNGDSTANLLNQSRITGDVLSWRDPMQHGPFPAQASLEDLAIIRGDYLSGPESDGKEAVRDFRLRDDNLRASGKYSRIVLWFEHDVLDQLQLLQILDWYSEEANRHENLQMVCINEFEGIARFRGLGELSVEQMETLQPEPITERQLALANRGWAAFRSDDPKDLEAFIATDLSALPFLGTALARHLEEFPSVDNGLTRTERQLLGLVAQGVSVPIELFLKNMDLETAFFMGDWHTWQTLGDLCSAKTPLITSITDSSFWYPPLTWRGREAFDSQELAITDFGRAVLSGTDTAFHAVQRDRWHGGVQIVSGENFWMWDSERKTLVRED